MYEIWEHYDIKTHEQTGCNQTRVMYLGAKTFSFSCMHKLVWQNHMEKMEQWGILKSLDELLLQLK